MQPVVKEKGARKKIYGRKMKLKLLREGVE